MHRFDSPFECDNFDLSKYQYQMKRCPQYYVVVSGAETVTEMVPGNLRAVSQSKVPVRDIPPVRSFRP